MGALSDHQNIKNGLSITQSCRPSGTMALRPTGADPTHPALLGPVSAPCPLLQAHGQLLPGAQMHRSARARIPLPGHEGLGIFKAVIFCILAQRPAPRATGQLRPCVWPAQLWTRIRPESGRPFTAARYKVQTRLSAFVKKIGKNRLAVCGIRAHHALSPRGTSGSRPRLWQAERTSEALLLCVGSGRSDASWAVRLGPTASFTNAAFILKLNKIKKDKLHHQVVF